MSTIASPPMASGQRLILLGAGHAHVQVLAELARRPWPGVEVTLVTPQPQLFHFPMVAGYLAGRYALDDCSIAVEPLARAGAVTWLRRSAVGLTANQNRLRLDDGSELAYQWLSINTGAVQDRDVVERALPGAREHGLFVQPVAALGALWPKVLELAASRSLRIAVVGGGESGIELAMAIRQRLPDIALTLVAGTAGMATGQSPAVRGRLMEALRQRRISVLPDLATHLNGDELSLASGARLACDVALLATGASAPNWLQHSDLERDAHGFVSVNAHQRSSSHPNVFAVGDVCTRLDGVLAHNARSAMGAGAALVTNLAALVAGRQLSPYTPPANSLKLLAYGDGRGIANWARFTLQGRLAWWWKDWLDRSFVRRHRLPDTPQP